MAYEQTLTRVETYFDRTATRAWEALTSDAPVSGIRATVRAGRDRMRAILLSRMSRDLTGLRILDAGCGTGALAVEMAARGAHVTGIDISPQLIDIAARRAPASLAGRLTFRTGDMLAAATGRFDHVTAMDSLIYYDESDLLSAIAGLTARIDGSLIFTVAPRTPLLMAMWRAGRLFPRADRSPVMVPQSARRLGRRLTSGRLLPVARVNCGFYISDALEVRP